MMFIILFFFTLICHIAQSQHTAVVILANGSPVRGLENVSITGKAVTEFLGIPYAEPPLGKLRFKPPLPQKPWKDIFNASSLPNTCYQEPDVEFPGFQGSEMWNPNTEISEDCLYLNVWVPGKINSTRNLTVMVWIYGGGFVSGSSTLEVYDGKIFSTEENVILVSMNYRVSVFGFLYTGLPEAPGNAGLLDQLEALKWVRANIMVFGGNPDKVTLFGESAGAASVSLHSLSPLSQPYFERFILQSGAATNPFSTQPTSVILRNALLLAEKCKCNVSKTEPDYKKLTGCLLKQSAKDISANSWVTDEFVQFPWTPIVDNYFLVEDPRDSLNNGSVKNGQVLLGSNLDEANFFIVYRLKDIYKKEVLFKKQDFITSDQTFDQCVNDLLPDKLKANSIVKDAIIFEYKDWELPSSSLKRQDALDKIFGDYIFTCNVNEYAEKSQRAGNTVYYYYFTHCSSQQTWPSWMGALHGYEINFVFGEPLNIVSYNYTKEEKQLAKKFMRYWANFARTGNPNLNPDGSLTQEGWPKYSENQQYLTLSINSSKIGNGPRRRECAFWKQYLPHLTASLSVKDRGK